MAPLRNTRRVVSVVATLLLAACTAASSDIYQVPPNIASPAPRNATNDVVRLINAERSARGLKPLAINADLQRAAQGHARQMAMGDCYAHECPGEPALTQRVRQAGYPYRKITENIHAAQLDPQRVVTGWMNSPHHRRNILDPDVTEIGVGHFYLAQDTGRAAHHHYWVADFGDQLCWKAGILVAPGQKLKPCGGGTSTRLR